MVRGLLQYQDKKYQNIDSIYPYGSASEHIIETVTWLCQLGSSFLVLIQETNVCTPRLREFSKTRRKATMYTVCTS